MRATQVWRKGKDTSIHHTIKYFRKLNRNPLQQWQFRNVLISLKGVREKKEAQGGDHLPIKLWHARKREHKRLAWQFNRSTRHSNAMRLYFYELKVSLQYRQQTIVSWHIYSGCHSSSQQSSERLGYALLHCNLAVLGKWLGEEHSVQSHECNLKICRNGNLCNSFLTV